MGQQKVNPLRRNAKLLIFGNFQTELTMPIHRDHLRGESANNRKQDEIHRHMSIFEDPKCNFEHKGLYIFENKMRQCKVVEGNFQARICTPTTPH